LEPKKLARLANVPPSKDARVSLPTTKESTVTPASKSLDLSANVDITAYVVSFEHNEGMVNAEVDGSDPNMTNDTVAAKFGHAFVQGIFVSLEDVVELMEVGSGRASFGPNDVVVALSVGEKGYGLVPSFSASEEAAANSSRVAIHSELTMLRVCIIVICPTEFDFIMLRPLVSELGLVQALCLPGLFLLCLPQTFQVHVLLNGPSGSFLDTHEISYVRISVAHFSNHPLPLESFKISSIEPLVITLILCFLKIILRDLAVWINASIVFSVEV
nr:hypothetical protein [Tanacetum cinerariifolium]